MKDLLSAAPVLVLLSGFFSVGCGSDGPAALVPQENCTDISYASFGQPFVQKYCIACHTSAASYPGADGYDFDTVDGIRKHGRAIGGHVLDGDAPVMPPPEMPQPEQGELGSLQEWLDCGAP